MEGDHSVISNFSRILNYGKTPFGKSGSRRLARLSQLHGEMSDHPYCCCLRSMHDAMAYRPCPVLLHPGWESARFFFRLERQAKNMESIKGIIHFSEEFINTGLVPDGSHGGFWAGLIMEKLLALALPDGLGPADQLTKGEYVPVVPVGEPSMLR